MPDSISTLAVIRQRSELYRAIRQYFEAQSVLEVEVPALGRSSALDPQLASMSLLSLGETYYLQTSPELFMKRLLARGSGSIFSICKSFRDGEHSPRHNPEFTMLEWYRLGFDLPMLMADVAGLLQALLPKISFETSSYADLFQELIGLNPHRCSLSELALAIKNHTHFEGELDRSASLDLLAAEVLEPALQKKPAVFVVDYPECQAAMAQTNLDDQGNRVARRFELYVHGVELANGYLELTDVAEQRQRFQHDTETRRRTGLTEVAIDQKLLAAMEQGIPDCSGVALGLDRLLWLIHGSKDNIDIGRHILFPHRLL